MERNNQLIHIFIDSMEIIRGEEFFSFINHLLKSKESLRSLHLSLFYLSNNEWEYFEKCLMKFNLYVFSLKFYGNEKSLINILNGLSNSKYLKSLCLSFDIKRDNYFILSNYLKNSKNLLYLDIISYNSFELRLIIEKLCREFPYLHINILYKNGHPRCLLEKS